MESICLKNVDSDVIVNAVFKLKEEVLSNERRLKFNLSPNPVVDMLYLSSVETNSIIRVLNLQGQVLKSVSSVKGQNFIEVNDLKPGVYVVSISGYNSTKFIKK